jgi:hypothetical protein
MKKQCQWTALELGCPRWTVHEHVSERERFIHSKDPYFLLIMELLGLIIKSFDNQTKMRKRE